MNSYSSNYAMIGSTRDEDCESMFGWETLSSSVLTVQAFNTESNSSANVDDESNAPNASNLQLTSSVNPPVLSSYLIGLEQLTSAWTECSFDATITASGSDFVQNVAQSYEYTVKATESGLMTFEFEVQNVAGVYTTECRYAEILRYDIKIYKNE